MKFSVRDLFLVTVIVALAVGWWVDRTAIKRRLQVYQFNAETHSGFIYKYERDELSLREAAGFIPAEARHPLSASATNPPKP
jgi:hypothetical protein